MERFEIWQAKIKFEDADVIKERPVLIWNGQVFLVAYKMTGTNRGRVPHPLLEGGRIDQAYQREAAESAPAGEGRPAIQNRRA